jgi:hypothetical protein
MQGYTYYKYYPKNFEKYFFKIIVFFIFKNKAHLYKI